MTKRPVLLFGGTGQLGQAIQRSDLGPAIVAPSSREVPLQDPVALEHIIAKVAPAAIVNAAAFTRVDDAERDEVEAYAINAIAPEILATASCRLGIRLVHVSTDYVFDGAGELPNRPDAPTRPLNVYGASKRDGELRVMAADPTATIIRTSWVHSGAGTNFVGTAVRMLTSGRSMSVVDDQVGVPTAASTLAEAVRRVLERPEIRGLQHVTDSGVASWYDVACSILDLLREKVIVSPDVCVMPVDSREYPRPAVRPKVSILDCHATRKALGFTPPHWTVGVRNSATAWLQTIQS